MGDVIRRKTSEGVRFYVRWDEPPAPAVNADGTPKLFDKGPRKGQPKVDGSGKPILERVRRMVLAKGARTHSEALQFVAAIERRRMQGLVGMQEPIPPTPEEQQRATITLKALCERFLTDYRSPKLKDPGRYERETRSVLSVRVWPHLGARPAGAVKAVDIERMTAALLAQTDDQAIAPRSVEIALAKLSKVYNWARRAGLVDCENPVAGCERPRSHPSLDYFSKVEAAQLLQYAEKKTASLYPMIATALYTGMRKGELFGLRWTDVHLDAGRIDVMRSYRLLPKSGKPRHLPLHPELARILRGWRDRSTKNGENVVFAVNGRMGDRYESLGLPELLAAADCHLPLKPWHALRHTFASHFMMAGGNILTLQKLLGHSDIKMTMIYAHLAPDFMAGEVARMSFAAGKLHKLGDRRRSATG